LQKVLEELKLSHDQFIDLCILLGCDYCDSIKGIGPVRAIEMIQKYSTIENLIKHLDSKYTVPESFDYQTVRTLFKEPEATDPAKLDLKWTEPDEEGLIQFLVKEKNFNEERVRKGIEKLKKSRQSSVQNRLTDYFGQPTIVKRKRDEKNSNSNGSKKQKGSAKSPVKSPAKSPVKRGGRKK